MNLRTIRANIYQWFLPTDETETTRKIAGCLYRNREITQRNGDADGDWNKAERIRKNEVRRLLFWANQPCIWAEKKVVEPVANCVEQADLFRIIARLSPTLEALGVIAIPLVLFFATQRYQENLQRRELEKLKQETVADYLNQLSTILLDVDGDLRDPQNEKLRTLTTATTLTLLRDPNLDGERRSQVMRFLFRMNLIDRDIVYGPERPDNMVTTLNFSGANLNNADLSNTFLQKASLSEAELTEADLSGASMFNSNLSRARLIGANLSFSELGSADLSNAEMIGANLINAYLEDANLSGARLVYANLSGANLSKANLKGTNLTEASLIYTNLSEAYLCETQLPETINIDPNRDCKTVERLYP